MVVMGGASYSLEKIRHPYYLRGHIDICEERMAYSKDAAG
jgi:hypothetical protein